MMSAQMQRANGDSISSFDADDGISRVETGAVAALARSETMTQLDAAHRYPRSVKRFLDNALTLATLNREVAESCIYALPRGGKVISGPSVRLAEIVASAYGNLHVAGRVIDAEEKEVVAQGVAWDLEANLRVTVEARRRITKSNGKRYDDDMIGVTGMAAQSIALRNAIFRVVPRGLVDTLYTKIREVAVGTATTLVARRAEVVARLQKIGVPIERIFPAVSCKAIEDVGLEQLEQLIGLGTAIKNGERSIDDAFPAIDETPLKAKKLEAELAAPKAEAKPEPQPDATKPKPIVELDPVAQSAPPTESEAPALTKAQRLQNEILALKTLITNAKTKKERTEIAGHVDAFCSSVDEQTADEMRRFHRLHLQEKAPREPGED